MLNKFKVVIVPDWAQSAIDASRFAFKETSNFPGLYNILSKSDLINYYIANKYFYDFFGKNFKASFEPLKLDFEEPTSYDFKENLTIALRYGDPSILRNYHYYLNGVKDDSVDGFAKKLGFDVIKCDGSVLWLRPIVVNSEDLVNCYNKLFTAVYPFVSMKDLANLPIFQDYETLVHNETAMLIS